MTLMMDTVLPVFANYMDGETARILRVRVALGNTSNGMTLRLHLPEGDPVDWPVPQIRRIPDQAATDSVVYGLAGDHPARLILRDRALNDDLSAMCPNLKRVNKTPNLWRRLSLLGAGAVASVTLIVFVLVPLMADQLAAVMPTKGEQAMGDATFEQIRRALDHNSDLGLRGCDTLAGRDALNVMAARLSGAASLPYPLRLHVLDHKMINAFALPGGHIVIFRGLLNDAKSAEEVAGVLGHEMGHIAHRDPTRLALRSAGSVGVLGLMLGDFAGGAAVLVLTEKLIQAQYTQGAEAAADTYSHALLAKAALPTGPMADFFDRLHAKYGSQKGLMSHLASHPDSAGRSNAARDANTVGADFVPVLTPAQWQSLKQICN